MEKDFAETSSYEMQLDECDCQIAVLEQNREGNKELLEQYYALREELEKKIKREENK